MIPILHRISAFIRLGEILRTYRKGLNGNADDELALLIQNAVLTNSWFIPEFVEYAVAAIAESLTEENLNVWADKYAMQLESTDDEKRVGVVMAGNIPLVGFHDFLCVLLSGNKIIAKLSSDDSRLLPAIARKLIETEPAFADQIIFTDQKLENFDAVIATGSNNTSRYFEYYFRNVPHIIRKNRNGIAVLTGNETSGELKSLGADVFYYFGMGCRNVAKLFVPKGYRFDEMLACFEDFRFVSDHHKYRNNYEYYKSIYLINGSQHYDNGFLIIKEDTAFSSPPSVLFYEEYTGIPDLNERLKHEEDQIQCIVSHSDHIPHAIPFGKAQKPDLWDYADGVDTMEFLMSLKN